MQGFAMKCTNLGKYSGKSISRLRPAPRHAFLGIVPVEAGPPFVKPDNQSGWRKTKQHWTHFWIGRTGDAVSR